MTEEQIREIVRDELEDLCLQQGGLMDEVRLSAFGMARAMILSLAQIVGEALPNDSRAPNPPPPGSLRARWEGRDE